ncbi:MAG: lysylphosphatidylglycerol synthase transmembrane domain-containing protein [Thermomicrobiales bacterium]
MLPQSPPRPATEPEANPAEPIASQPEASDVITSERPSLRSRLLSPHTIGSFLFAAIILWFAVKRLAIDPAAIWSEIRQASPQFLLGALALWYGAFAVRAWRWRQMILFVDRSRDDSDWHVPPTRGLTEIMTLSFFANSLVPAKLGDAYRGYLLKRDGNVPLSAGFGTILAERFTDAMMLLVVLGAAVAVVFGGNLPPQARPALTLAAILLVVALAGLGAMWVTRDVLVRYLPSRIQETYARLHESLFRSFGNPFLIFGIGLLLWCGDGMRVWLVAHSLNAPVPPQVALLVAVMGALLTIIPFTPAGLGVVELGIGSMLVGVFGIEPAVAGSIILLDRVVAYWSLLVVGTALYARRTRRELLLETSARLPS